MTKTMTEKLSEHYALLMKRGNDGHAVGYCPEIPEKIQSEYVFPKGIFASQRAERVD